MCLRPNCDPICSAGRRSEGIDDTEKLAPNHFHRDQQAARAEGMASAALPSLQWQTRELHCVLHAQRANRRGFHAAKILVRLSIKYHSSRWPYFCAIMKLTHGPTMLV
jgi:hypothetical protein